MEREILFRGKIVSTGQWIHGSLMIEKDGTHSIYDLLNTPDSAEIVTPETIGQFTGLTDKNGKKIFEGDICLHGTCGGIQTNAVEFYRYGFFVGDYPISEDCEVVGNIYDNPELLKN